MFCGNCGKKNPDYAKFCTECGTPLQNASSGYTPPVKQTKTRKKGAFFKRLLVCLLVYLVCYGIGYALSSPGGLFGTKSKEKTVSADTNSYSGVNLNENTSQDSFTVNAYADHWSDVRIWAWSDLYGDLFLSWPGEAMNDDGSGWYSYSVPQWVDYVIISGNNGLYQTADLQVEAQELWIIVYSDNAASITYEDPGTAEDPWGGCEIIPPVAPAQPVVPEVPVQPAIPVVTEAPAQPESGYIADLGGWWEQVHLEDGSFSLNVSALRFSETVYNCTGLTVNMEVEMNAGTSCKDWQLWGRNNGQFVKLAKIYLPAGTGYVSQSVTFANPVTFDALVVTPTIMGGYSWGMAMSITDVYTK